MDGSWAFGRDVSLTGPNGYSSINLLLSELAQSDSCAPVD